MARCTVLVGLAIVWLGGTEAAAQDERVVVLPAQARGKLPADIVTLMNELLPVSMDEFSSYGVITKDDIDAQVGLESLKENLGCDDIKCAAEIGGALGAKYLLSAKAVKAGSKLILTLTLIDAQQTIAVKRAKVKAPLDPETLDGAIEWVVRDVLGLDPPPYQPGGQTSSAPTGGMGTTSQPEPPQAVALAGMPRRARTQDEKVLAELEGQLNTMMAVQQPKLPRAQEIETLAANVAKTWIKVRELNGVTPGLCNQRDPANAMRCVDHGMWLLVEDAERNWFSASEKFLTACRAELPIGCDMSLAMGTRAARTQLMVAQVLEFPCEQSAYAPATARHCGLLAEAGHLDDAWGGLRRTGFIVTPISAFLIYRGLSGITSDDGFSVGAFLSLVFGSVGAGVGLGLGIAGLAQSSTVSGHAEDALGMDPDNLAWAPVVSPQFNGAVVQLRF